MLQNIRDTHKEAYTSLKKTIFPLGHNLYLTRNGRGMRPQKVLGSFFSLPLATIADGPETSPRLVCVLNHLKILLREGLRSPDALKNRRLIIEHARSDWSVSGTSPQMLKVYTSRGRLRQLATSKHRDRILRKKNRTRIWRTSETITWTLHAG